MPDTPTLAQKRDALRRAIEAWEVFAQDDQEGEDRPTLAALRAVLADGIEGEEKSND